MATKSTFDPGAMFNGDLWKNLDDETKDLFRNLLKQAGVGMQMQNEGTRLARAGVRPGQYLSDRQRREIISPEPPADKLARLRFHGGIANGRWVTDYDTWKANRTAKDDERLANMKPLAFRVPTARENPAAMKAFRKDPNVLAFMFRSNATSDYRGVRLMEDGTVRYSFGDTTEARRRRRDALSTLSQYTPERSRRLKDLEDAYNLLKTEPFGAEKGGATMRERGWLDTVFNGGIVRAALKGGKGHK